MFDVLPMEHLSAGNVLFYYVARHLSKTVSQADLTIPNGLLLCQKCVDMCGLTSITPNMHFNVTWLTALRILAPVIHSGCSHFLKDNLSLVFIWC